MRALTAEFKRELFSQEMGIVPIVLITINHETLAEPIYISTDPTQRLSATTDTQVVYGTISNGIEYVYLPVKLTLPGESEEGPTPAKIELDNVHRTYIETLRSITSPPTFNLSIVTDTNPDTVVTTWPEYLLVNTKYDVDKIQATLQLEQLYNEPYPALTFNPAFFPAMFRTV